MPSEIDQARRRLATALQRVEANPTDQESLLELAACHTRLGDALQSDHQLDEAAIEYGAALTIARQRWAVNPNESWAFQLTEALRRLGDLDWDRGDDFGSLAHRREDLEFVEQLATSTTVDSGVLHDLALAYDRVADTLAAVGYSEEALENYGRAVEIARAVAERPGRPLLWGLEQASRHTAIASLFAGRGDHDEALLEYRQAEELLEPLLPHVDTEPRILDELGLCLERTSEALLECGKLPGAVQKLRQALSIRLRAAEMTPDDPQRVRDLAMCRDLLGESTFDLGDLETAYDLHRQASLSLAQLLSRYPRDTLLRQDIAQNLHNLGDVQLQQGHAEAALASYRRSYDLSTRHYGDAAEPDRDGCLARQRIAGALAQLGQHSEAVAELRSAFATLEALSARNPLDLSLDQDIAACHVRLAESHLALDETVAARHHFDRGVEILRRLAALDPRQPGPQRDLAVAYNDLGNLQHTNGEYRDALESHQAAQDILDKLVALDEFNSEWRYALAISHERTGLAHLELENLELADTHFRTAFDLGHPLAEADPTNADRQRSLAHIITGLSDVERAYGRWDTALEYSSRALAILQRLVDAHPGDPQLRIHLVDRHEAIAELLTLLQRGPEAARHRELAAALERDLGAP